MSWVVAIPSYSRPEVVKKKTLQCLKDGKVPASRIFVFVVKDQLEGYESIVPKELYNKMIVGEKGLVNQRQFINDYFKKGQDIVCMDDDIRALKHLTTSDTKDKSKNKIAVVTDLPKFFDMAFKVMKENKANIWGISAVANPFYMSDKVTTDLKYIVGAFYGIHNTKDPAYVLKFGDNQEDKERTARYFKKDGVVVRFGAYAPVTTYYAPGGLDSSTRKAETKAGTEVLMKAFPTYFKQLYKSARGIYDLQFKRSVGTEGSGRVREIDTEETGIQVLPIRSKSAYETAKTALLEELKKVTVKRLGRPRTDPKNPVTGRADVIGTIGRTMTMGYGMVKFKGYREFVANKQYPELLKRLVAFGNRVVPKGWDYETITVNHGVKAKKHKDVGNAGDSVIIGIGDFTGGDIKVWDEEDKNPEEYNLHDQPLMFNGANHFHQTMPFKGDRYTFIFYRQKREGHSKGVTMVGKGEEEGLDDEVLEGGIFA